MMPPTIAADELGLGWVGWFVGIGWWVGLLLLVVVVVVVVVVGVGRLPKV